MLEMITFPIVDGREFILTLNGQPVMVPVERVREQSVDIYDGHCCAYSAAMAGFGTACEQCKVSFG